MSHDGFYGIDQSATFESGQENFISLSFYHSRKVTNAQYTRRFCAWYNKNLTAERVSLFQPKWASSVQCRHWSRHMAKASFIPLAWVANTGRTSADTLPRQSAQTTCEQVMSFAPKLKSVATPVKSAQQLGSQTDQVSWLELSNCRQGCLFFGLCGPHQCSADTGAGTWQKQAFHHMPGWLTLAKLQVQTPYRDRDKNLDIFII